jgi:hypothetical protein
VASLVVNNDSDTEPEYVDVEEKPVKRQTKKMIKLNKKTYMNAAFSAMDTDRLASIKKVYNARLTAINKNIEDINTTVQKVRAALRPTGMGMRNVMLSQLDVAHVDLEQNVIELSHLKSQLVSIKKINYADFRAAGKIKTENSKWYTDTTAQINHLIVAARMVIGEIRVMRRSD